MTDDVIRIRRSPENNSIVKFAVDATSYEFDSGIDYTNITIYLKKNIVVVLHSLLSKNASFVGAIFDFSGKKIFDIPYPELGSSYVHCQYSWSSEIENGLKMVFITDSFSYGDFWCDFDVDRRVYVATGESR